MLVCFCASGWTVAEFMYQYRSRRHLLCAQRDQAREDPDMLAAGSDLWQAVAGAAGARSGGMALDLALESADGTSSSSIIANVSDDTIDEAVSAHMRTHVLQELASRMLKVLRLHNDVLIP